MASKPVVIAYVPVLHAGYKTFFERQARTADNLYVLGSRQIKEIDHLRKEIRALSPQSIVSALKQWNIFKNVEVLNAKTLLTIRKSKSPVVMPKEDVSREFAEKHLTNNKISYSPVFLRWDRDNSRREKQVREDARISKKAFDQKMMAAAQKSGEKTSDWWRQVGAVLIKNGAILIASSNQHRPSPHVPWAEGDPRNSFTQGDHLDLSTSQHAESSIVSMAAKKGMALEGADLYVTDFPCPPCAKLIAYSGIKRCFFERGYAVLDGQRILKQNGVKIIRVTGSTSRRDPEAFLPYPKKTNLRA